MSCRTDPSHSGFGCGLHSLGDLLSCLCGFLSFGSRLLYPFDPLPALLDGLGRIGLGLGCGLPALDGLLASWSCRTSRSCRITFPGCTVTALCRAGNLTFDAGRFPTFLDLPVSKLCQFPAPIICGFRPLLDSSLCAGQHLISSCVGRRIVGGFLLTGKGRAHGFAQSLIFGMEPHLLHGGFGHDPCLIKGAGLAACRLCFYLFQDLTSLIGYMPGAWEVPGCLFSYSSFIPCFVFSGTLLVPAGCRAQQKRPAQ